MIRHTNGLRSKEFTDKIPYHLRAALKLDGKPLSIHAIVKMTGYNFDTVKRHIGRLCAAGIVETVPSGDVKFRLVETQPEEEVTG